MQQSLINLVKKTGIHRLANRMAPRSYQRWQDYHSIKSQVAQGYELVDLPELEREYKKAVSWLIDNVGRDAIGDYLEFGVFYGSSLACMHKVLDELGVRHTRLFGFDSFEGLPESLHPDDKVWGAGEFKSSYAYAREFLTERGVDWNRVFLTKGWFSDTLIPSFIQQERLKKAGLIMVDCDMYVSAKQALDFCGPLIQDEAIVFFDDWNSGGLAEGGQGEKRAFDEFLKQNPGFQTEEFGAYAYKGKPNAKVFRIWRATADRAM